MTLNTLKCNHLMPLPFKGLNSYTNISNLLQRRLLYSQSINNTDENA